MRGGNCCFDVLLEIFGLTVTTRMSKKQREEKGEAADEGA
jgi:hypothetical protein